MVSPPPLPNEACRLAALHALDILDTPPEERFDRITRLARRLFDVPMVLVSLVDADRQWFKSRVGVDASETHRSTSFCGHAIATPKLMVVRDAKLDPRFQDNPLVLGPPFVRFYAGRPLRGPSGDLLGTLCIISDAPRDFSAEDAGLLGDLAEMVEAELRHAETAIADVLTGLPNRRGLMLLGAYALGRAARTRQPLSLLFFDLDHFKRINDTLGHAQGDRVLAAFATALKQTFRSSDVPARLAGDEFCVLLSDTPLEGSGAALRRLRATLDVADDPVVRTLGFSVGTATYVPDRHETFDTLLHEADQAMYVRKRTRRDPGGPPEQGAGA